MTPFDRRAKRALALVEVFGAAGEKLQPLIETAQEDGRGERTDARRGQLNREREPVQAEADLRDGLSVLAREREVRGGGVSALHEQSHGLGGLDFCEIRPTFQVGESERRNGIRVLPGQMERCPARRQDAKPRGRCEQAGDCRRGCEEVLEVVQDEQELLVADIVGQRLQGRLARVLAEAECPRDRGGHELPVLDGRERDEEDAVREPLDQVCGYLEREPCLARAPGSGEREKAQVLACEQRLHLGELARTADERARQRRKIRRAVVEGLQRRELGRQAVQLELVEVLGL